MKFNYSKGFTLVELLTAMTLFLAVSGIVFGAAASLIQYQEQMVAMQGMLNDSSYVLEYMGRFMRMARRDPDGGCLSLGQNFQNPGADTTNVRFLDHDGNCRRFFLENGQIKEETDKGIVPLTSSNHTIDDLSFVIVDEVGQQPRVTVSFDVVNSGLDIDFNLQTTVSQRNLNL